MNLKVIVGVLIVIAGATYLFSTGFFRSGDFDEIDPMELSEISAYLAKGKTSGGSDPIFRGYLQPAWDELGFADKNAEAEKMADNLRARGFRRASIRLGERAVIDMGPTSVQLHDFPRGVRPKSASPSENTVDEVAPTAEDP